MNCKQSAAYWLWVVGMLVSGCAAADQGTTDSVTAADQGTTDLVTDRTPRLWAVSTTEEVDTSDHAEMRAEPVADTIVDTAHPSTGWLDLEDSPIHPWCAAVLVAPNVVVTATPCATTSGAPLRFGTGIPTEGGTRVVRVEVLSDARVAALVLEGAVTDVEPAASMTSAEEGEALEGIAMSFSLRNEVSQRWIWDGALRMDDDGTFMDLPPLVDEDFAQAPLAGAPNCHGDSGAGVYTRDGALAGIVVGARRSGASWCIDSIALAVSLDEGADLLAEARALAGRP